MEADEFLVSEAGGDDEKDSSKQPESEQPELELAEHDKEATTVATE
ncbi:unnamed protein product [Enterobius vermicularis]|uniref:CTNNB1_binding domain-containing protein n=1 Tax=Enterobius vermicularis TaxID=51028 RepID=A0A0N4VQQ2_ENTVE|nr:unnamed protein product [Enterobius vermicularis]